MLNEEQAQTIKAQLIQQIEKSFPEDKKQFAISQIESMGSEELEQFLVKNNLVQRNASGENSCVFCSIVFGDIKSFKINENAKAIAVLDINPIAKGHTLIIPKEHISSEAELPKTVQSLAKKVASTLKKRLSPQDIKIESANVMGHQIINLVPLYGDSKTPLQRISATHEELQELQEKLTKKVSTGKKKRVSTKKKNPLKKIVKEIEKIEKRWIPRRIP